MIIGVPRETKRDEYRVGMLPVGVEEFTRAGHQVVVEAGAGLGSGLADHDYLRHGAELVPSAQEVYDRAGMVVKVKEPQPEEIDLLRPGQVVFAYFHFAADRKLTEAVLASGARTPVLVEREDLRLMKPGSVIIDVAVDQGGCVATSRPTTHSDPTFVVDEVVHYCVTNMPGAVGRTSTFALCNVTLPWALRIAELGLLKAAAGLAPLARAVNTFDCELTNRAVAETFQMPYNNRFEK